MTGTLHTSSGKHAEGATSGDGMCRLPGIGCRLPGDGMYWVRDAVPSTRMRRRQPSSPGRGT